MGRNYGLEVRTMYSEADFKDACWFNYIMGFFSGIALILLSELGFAYFKGWIW